MQHLVLIFQALSDLTRSKVIYALTQGELSVGQLAEMVGASSSAVSHHLRRLRDADLVTFHRHGNRVLYNIDDDHVAAIFEEALNHIDHVEHRSTHPKESDS
jgi:DNA-binding transcriptional ArsR family regulator